MTYSAIGDLHYEYERGSSPSLSPCPGLYCGRTKMPDGNWSECGGCPRGFRKGSSFGCVPCDEDLGMYGWLYLGFMALLPIILHFATIDSKLLKHSKTTLGLVICAILEVSISASITLLLWEPMGSFKIHACGVTQLADWYPVLFNPHPNYEETLYCAHEAVYPLYTIILVFYGMADVLMIVIRIIAYFLGIKVARSIYSGLYFYPILAFGHLILGGIVYSIFPYLTIVVSVISCAYHFAKRKNQTLKELVCESVKNWQNLGVILCHWFLHAYGIISITLLSTFERDLCLLLLVPVPALLYIFTANYTDPDKIMYGE